MNLKDKSNIYQAFISSNLEVKSVSKNKNLEWKCVTDVTKHDVSKKSQYKVIADGGVCCCATGDHSLFLDKGEYIEECKTGEFKEGDPLVYIGGEIVGNKKVLSVIEIEPEKFMYDLSVEDNENFVLKSGVLAHNSFRPPSNEKFLQTQTRVFGYIWEEYELYEYLLMAVDYFNTAPPVTGITLMQTPDRWRSVILLKAASIACGALAINWISEEYSLVGNENLVVKDENGIKHTISIEELYDIIYGELIRNVCEQTDLECAEAMELIRGWENEDK